MFSWLTNLFRRETPAEPAAPADDGPVTLRRWESSQTDRLNSAHWAKVTGREINADLSEQLPTLRSRCRYEAANNPMVAGVIETHTVDVVGPHGPQLQVRSSDEQFNEWAETVWRKWWAMPDAGGRLSGVDFLRGWMRALWTDGEFLAQYVTARNLPRNESVTLRLLDICTDRLGDDPKTIGDPNVAMGVRVDEFVRPTQYYIARAQRFGSYVSLTEYDPIPADMILHRFQVLEPGQVRGVPWLASSLQMLADLRDYDTQILDAARQAADFAILLYTEHPEAPFVNNNENWQVERRRISHIPPGWKAEQMKPEQPSTGYIDYRAERHRDLGRPVNMPLMTVRLDASKHNYSSARMDSQGYNRGNESLQGWIGRGTLSPLAETVIREAALAERRQIPSDVLYEWTWAKRPHVDPQKEAVAMQTLLQMGAISLADVCASLGTDLESVIAKRVRSRDLLEAAGLDSSVTGDAGASLESTIDAKLSELQEAADMGAAA